MSIERSHGKARVTRPRTADAGTDATAEERRRQNHGALGKFTRGNDAAAGRGGKAVIESPSKALAKATSGLAEGSEVAQLTQDARTLYRAVKRQVASDSMIVLGSLMTFARETVLAGYLTDRAMVVGVTSEDGRALLELAQKAENRAERASLHAVSLAEKLGAKRGGSVLDLAGAIEAAAKPREKP